MPITLEGPSLAPLSCGKAVYLVVLLHGMGSDGQGLIDIALNWQPTSPKAEFVAPHGPFACDGGRQWFNTETQSLEAQLAATREAAAILDTYLDELLAARRLDDSHLALLGFSQGAALALHVGLRRQKPIAGIVAFSGSLPFPELVPEEMRIKPPVLLVHGEADPIVPFESMRTTKDALKALDVPVRALKRPGLGHAIDDDGVIAADDFLIKNLVPKAKAAGHDHDHDHDHDH